MNPKNDNLDYLLGLPTPRLLEVYRKHRSQVFAFDDWHYGDYSLYSGKINEMSPEDREKIPRFVPCEVTGRTRKNRMFDAYQIYKDLEKCEIMKKELDRREHIPRKVAK